MLSFLIPPTIRRLLRQLPLVIAAGMWAGGSALIAEDVKKVKAATTIGMVADLVKQVGGDRVAVDQLMGPGVDPHLYKPAATDVTRLARAEVIFYSGLMLEGRMGDVFAKMARSGKKVYPITETVAKTRLLEPPEFEGHYDPHIWFDVSMWAECLPAVITALSEVDPAGKADYEKNGAEAKLRMTALHEWCLAEAAKIPAEKRILVTSHDAYNYFGRAYGFKVVGIQGVSTVTEAGLSDIAKMVDFIKEKNVKAIFVETSVSPATIERVSKDSGAKVGGELFSDAMGAPGEKKGDHDVGTYEGMVKYNLSTIVKALQ